MLLDDDVDVKPGNVDEAVMTGGVYNSRPFGHPITYAFEPGILT